MKFGWLTLALSPSPEHDAGCIEDQVEQACLAEALGFDDVWLTEHYFTGESVYNDPLIFASALAMRTSRIRIGFAVLQLSLHHPVRLAVQLALLDNLSRGRLDVGVGRGTVYNEYEFVGYGLRSNDSRSRMTEALEVMTRAWTEAPLSFEGEHFQIEIPELRPKPFQSPHPPIWRSVISQSSFSECGQLGVPILTARLPVERIAERWADYRSGLEAGNHSEARKAALLEQCALWRNIYVADSRAQAEDELSELLLETRRHMMHVRHAYNPPDFQIEPAMLNPWTDPTVDEGVALPQVLEAGSIYGTAEDVRQQIAAVNEAGVNHLLCQMAFGDTPHSKVVASMRRFGEEVMPAFSTGRPAAA